MAEPGCELLSRTDKTLTPIYSQHGQGEGGDAPSSTEGFDSALPNIADQADKGGKMDQ